MSFKKLTKAFFCLNLCMSALWAAQTGDTAVDFSLETMAGDTFTLSKSDSTVRVLYFFGCG